jgi:hypothetical protein
MDSDSSSVAAPVFPVAAASENQNASGMARRAGVGR